MNSDTKPDAHHNKPAHDDSHSVSVLIAVNELPVTVTARKLTGAKRGDTVALGRLESVRTGDTLSADKAGVPQLELLQQVETGGGANWVRFV